jgi:hypothetical protein
MSAADIRTGRLEANADEAANQQLTLARNAEGPPWISDWPSQNYSSAIES